MDKGDSLEVISIDPGFKEDIYTISHRKGFTVEELYRSKGQVKARVKKKD